MEFRQEPRGECRRPYSRVIVDSPEARRFAQAVQMADQGIEMMRQNLRRRHPEESDREIDERIEVLPGLDIPVAQVGQLISLKLLARDDATRPQDAGDLRALIGVASGGDLALARESAQLIEDRGYARGRDLTGSLDALVSETG